ncbi:hypothetical protein Pmani_001836 [Petrolisthes manimaculis]|uniref:Uncharacterized protein n=1 Tax=Petrolisthes manimaculis TaxID=1843537 RepID=A0AAE1QIS1_9EUCA|nr:hypothetical protein Pmani_001836 [Petrolisthes manimaculis]
MVLMWRCAVSTPATAQHIGRSGLAQLVVMTTSDVRGGGVRKAKLWRWRLVRGGYSFLAFVSVAHNTPRNKNILSRVLQSQETVLSLTSTLGKPTTRHGRGTPAEGQVDGWMANDREKRISHPLPSSHPTTSCLQRKKASGRG